ncbi:unnamed protein product [Gordionus sp. m RMFG-2023]
MNIEETIQWIFTLPLTECITELLLLLKTSSCQGWNIDLIYEDNYLREYKSIVFFLDANGPIIDCIKRLLYENCPTLIVYLDKNNKLLNSNQSLSLNAFEYYFWNFFSYFGRIKENEDDCDNTFSYSAYDEIVHSYCFYFYPFNVDKNIFYKENHFHSYNIEDNITLSVYNHQPLFNLCNSAISFITSKDIANSFQTSLEENDIIKMIIYNNKTILNEIFSPENYASILFLKIFLMTNIYQNAKSKCSNHLIGQQQINVVSELPSVNQICLSRSVLSHLLQFCDTKSPLTAIKLDETTLKSLLLSSKSEKNCDANAIHYLKRYIFPLMIRDQFLDYYVQLFNRWPFLPSFKWIIDSWLTYIQPWKHSHDLGFGSKLSLHLWKNYLRANEPYYTVIFNRFVSRMSQLDLTISQNACQLYRVLKVFVKGDLYQLLNQIERPDNLPIQTSDPILNFNPSFSSANSSLIRLRLLPNLVDSRKNLSTSLNDSYDKRDEFSKNPNDKSSKFRRLYVKALRMFLDKIWRNYIVYPARYAYFSLKYGYFNGSGYSDEIDESPLFLSLMARKGMISSSNPNYIDKYHNNAERNDKCIFYLDESIRMLEIMFGPIAPNYIPVLKKSSSPNNNLSFYQNAYNTPKTVLNRTGILSSSIPLKTPKLYTPSSASLLHLGGYETRPIRSYENAYLVRVLYKISTLLNNKFQTKLNILYNKEDLYSVLLSLIISPIVSFRPVISSPPRSPIFKNYSPTNKMSQTLRPCINLRFLANYYFIGYMLFFTAVLSFFGWGYKKMVTWLFILSMANSFCGLNVEDAQNGTRISPVSPFKRRFFLTNNNAGLIMFKKNANKVCLYAIFIGLVFYTLLIYTLQPITNFW